MPTATITVYLTDNLSNKRPPIILNKAIPSAYPVATNPNKAGLCWWILARTKGEPKAKRLVSNPSKKAGIEAINTMAIKFALLERETTCCQWSNNSFR